MTLSGRSALVVVIGGIASLCLSLFLISFIAGGIWRDHGRGPWGDGPMGMHDGGPDGKPGDGKPNSGKGGGLMMPVPPEIRAELEPFIAPHRAEIEQTRAAMRNARMALSKALGAEPFDPAAFQTALENMQQQGAAAQKLMHDLMIETVPQLKPEVRRRWAQRMGSHMDGPPPDAPPPYDAPVPPAGDAPSSSQ